MYFFLVNGDSEGQCENLRGEVNCNQKAENFYTGNVAEGK